MSPVRTMCDQPFALGPSRKFSFALLVVGLSYIIRPDTGGLMRFLMRLLGFVRVRFSLLN